MELNEAERILRLEAVGSIRNVAASTCLYALQHTFNTAHKVSELHFRNLWLKTLEKSFKRGFVSCWYDPPPGGIAAILNDGKDFSRVTYTNLRQKEYWPRADVYFKDDNTGYLFASPYTMVDNVPIIGDFGFTFYLGNSPKIKKFYRKCYDLLNKLIENIQTGMMFKDLYALSQNAIEKEGLQNYIFGITDKQVRDFGHTVPFTDRNPDRTEAEAIFSGKPEKINSAISHARVFINEIEEYKINDNCAFTFEPRFIEPSDNSLPMTSFHTIIRFIDGQKEILTNFKGIFNFLKMDWISG